MNAKFKQDLFDALDEYFEQRDEISLSAASKKLGICRNTMYKRIEMGEISQLPNGKISRKEIMRIKTN